MTSKRERDSARVGTQRSIPRQSPRIPLAEQDRSHQRVRTSKEIGRNFAKTGSGGDFFEEKRIQNKQIY